LLVPLTSKYFPHMMTVIVTSFEVKSTLWRLLKSCSWYEWPNFTCMGIKFPNILKTY
jgi:hypothetical protein